MYQHCSGKHRFVNTASSRKQLSHIAIHILYFNPAWPIATSTRDPSSGDAWTFALLDATNVAYVFPPSEGSDFVSLDGGCYSVPMAIRVMLGGSDIKKLVDRYEAEVSRLKLAKEVLEDSVWFKITCHSIVIPTITRYLGIVFFFLNKKQSIVSYILCPYVF